VPAIVLVTRIQLVPRTWTRAVLARIALLVAMCLLGALGAVTSLQSLSSFLRNQREVRYLVTPANVIVSLTKVISEQPPGKARVQLPIGEDAVQRATPGARTPRLLVVVVGETARAANWGLSGYARQTTPALAQRNVVNYPNVGACGSSTEVSLPCMFSPYGRRNYNEKFIRGHQSVLHVLQRAGVHVLWRDNQSGCKGVCSGLEVDDLHARTYTDVCEGNRCYDQILLKDLAQAARRHRGDQVIVLHMLGNHGPTYAERYPRTFERFTPVCTTSDLGRCERNEIVNAYDNALLYTDHVLGNTIDALAQMTDYDTAMLYVSDHGESLGENGLFLHGMPYAIAPKEQLQVPMVAWFSQGWQWSTRLDMRCVQQHKNDAYSHDNLFHTLLGLTGVDTRLYEPGSDMYARCRPSSGPSG
jgi:lipid A ethanolaminephosphotransferase